MIEEAYVSFETAKLLKEKGFNVKPFHQYYVSNCGKVFGCRGNEMKTFIANNGYVKIRLTINGKQQNYSVHRLVAMLFIDNPEQKLEVNHLDGNKQNNNVSNLEWCTRTENERHARQTGLKTPVIGKYLGKDNKLSKPFVCIETGKIYYCLRELWEELGYTKNCVSHISRACKYGYLDHDCHWRYYEPNDLVKLLFEKGYRKYPLSYDGDIWFCYVQMAMRWLMEVHNLCIEPYRTACGYLFTISKIWTGSELYSAEYCGDDEASGQFTTWEKCVEYAIKYCLEHLID